jgi:hypothetical protein
MAERGRKPATILWDLDDTIGNFSGIRLRTPEAASPIQLRYGIRDLLTEFSEDAGYCHYITSSAGTSYVNEALNRAYLHEKFARTFGNDTVKQTIDGKHYRPVAKGFSEEEMQSRMIVIGDSDRDKPVDVGGMVFIELGNPEEPIEALVIREIVTTILDEGDGSFRDGYEKLYSRAEPVRKADRQHAERRRLNIGNDIEFAMEYRQAAEIDNPNLQNIPVICNIKTETHKRPFEIFF